MQARGAVVALLASVGIAAGGAGGAHAASARMTSDGYYWKVWTWGASQYLYYYNLCWYEGGIPVILAQYGGPIPVGITAQYTLLGCAPYQYW